MGCLAEGLHALMRRDCSNQLPSLVPAGAEATRRCGHAGPAGARLRLALKQGFCALDVLCSMHTACQKKASKQLYCVLLRKVGSTRVGMQVPSARGRRRFTLARAITAIMIMQDAKAITAALVAVLPICGLTTADPSSDACSLSLAHDELPQHILAGLLQQQASMLDLHLAPRVPKVWTIKAEPLRRWEVAPHAALKQQQPCLLRLARRLHAPSVFVSVLYAQET